MGIDTHTTVYKMAAISCISGVALPARISARRSGIQGKAVRMPRAVRGSVSVRAMKTVAESKTFDDDWLKADVTVHLLTLFGWSVPSGIAIKSYGDTSLLAAFSASIGENLANFPQGPGLEDKFWLYLLTWHIGLFSTMLLGQIGWQGRKQGYFK